MSPHQHPEGRQPGRAQDSGTFNDWSEGLTPGQEQLQVHLSCLVDGELDEVAAAHVMVQMEESAECRAFFDDARRFVRLHKDMADPDRLEARLAMMTGALLSGDEMAAEAERCDVVHRLATIFYQLGKAHVLAGTDGKAFRERVFEAAVPVESVDHAKAAGRGFVDGILMAGKDARTGLNWREARHLLNGRLEQISEPLEKGHRLLEQALETDPTHEEARIYLGFLYTHQGKTIKAARVYREVFDSALTEANRGHAANQLGRLYCQEEDFRRALVCWRWVTMSGLADRDERFWMARFNIGVVYAMLGDRDRSLNYFRRLLDAHPGHEAEVAHYFATGPELREAIDSQAGFAEALMARCPELFQEGAAH
jgi:tetratricopeptide (TPR) repeat protein